MVSNFSTYNSGGKIIELWKLEIKACNDYTHAGGPWLVQCFGPWGFAPSRELHYSGTDLVLEPTKLTNSNFKVNFFHKYWFFSHILFAINVVVYY